MADAQGGPSPPPSSSSSSSSWSSTLSIVDDDTEVQHCTNPEAGEEFSNEKEQEREEEKQKDEDENKEEEEEQEDEDQDKDEDEDEEADNAFQVSHYRRMGYSRQEELRKILRALRGEPDENQNRRCTRCTAMGHVCLDCPLPIRFIPWSQRQEYVPQQNPTLPNQAHSLGQGQATNSSEAGRSGSSSQEVNPETKVPSVSSASASQLRKRKSDSGSEMGSSTKKL